MTANNSSASRQHLETLADLQHLVQKHDLLKTFSLKRLGVFGSFARNEPANDIDLLIEDDMSLETALQFKQSLEVLVDNPLDIMLQRWANPVVLYRAKQDLRYVEA